ncbi:sugar ABC transporter permease [Ktedonobacter sp. SOSP1-85]|uniref:carbohydrate ABC transporter permease n=1 Tax=unclassified Ktedonobacter TaxID=388461 RepID=UPI0019154A34|nr:MULTISPECIES: carbohydrate ABC transporter permease [unclassified Ktedonobacter]GHO71036.1 sugar ABC transporter permease [Ktedonobacter sp. SOSP1-52]GHO80692.1 sugar ABC transporter permease [Ktedonobacter sp. SOSP1-85]
MSATRLSESRQKRASGWWGAQLRRGARYLVIIIATLIAVFPIYYMLVTSLLTTHNAYDVVPHILPDWEWSNYVRAWNMAPWLQYFGNSLFVALCTIVLATLTSLLAAYAFGTMKFPGRHVLFMLLLGIIMVPSEATLIPSYLLVSTFHWINSYQAQIIPFGVSISGIFLLRQFFLALPPSLWEAAQLDGCSRFGYLWRVAAPLARPALAVIALQIFIGSWNAFLWPYLVTSTDAFRPVEVGLRAFVADEGNDPTGLAAAVAFTTLPVLVVFLIAQKQFIEGISAGSTKG